MSKKSADAAKSNHALDLNLAECPFREFRDNELQTEFWGMGPAAFRAALCVKSTGKLHADHVWVDEQTQPLPRSVRHFIHGWVRAEDLAFSRWEAETVVFEETNGGKMSVTDIQLSHAQVLQRSSFSRRVLSTCYLLERVDPFLVEHQWENFSFSFAPEGWRGRYHIYSPGMKPGGGQQHRPSLSRNGCYLVRLFHLGAWRCVWVNDQVPVDANGSPLLPFSPLTSNVSTVKSGGKTQVTMVTSPVVHLWPLLICKALLKLAAPDMNSDEELDIVEDEPMPEFNVMHCLTGSMNIAFHLTDPDELWKLITAEVPQFTWDDDDDTVASTIRSKTKKPTAKETAVVRRSSMTSIIIVDTKSQPPYSLPGIAPAHEMPLIVSMARDLPLKKPLPEPVVPQWKHYRWIDWARGHGLYEAYDCPRTRYLKVNGLLKLSHAPHLLDILSTDSITATFREEHDKTVVPTTNKKGAKDVGVKGGPVTGNSGSQIKEELREWVQYNAIYKLVKSTNILYYPSMYQFASAGSNIQVRVTKVALSKPVDIVAPKYAPLYLQIDNPDENILNISLSALHPRILLNCGMPVVDYIEPAHLILEEFEWFVDCEIPRVKAFLRTRGYDSTQIKLKPGRHVFRIWVHSRVSWHIMLLSESSLLLGTRDVVQSAAVRECPWASRFLSRLGMAFSNWIKVDRSYSNVVVSDREFYRSYQPDLIWNEKEVGYKKSLLHWMFRQTLQYLLVKRLQPLDYRNVCIVLRRYLCDPNFGFLEKPPPPKLLSELVTLDMCDCELTEIELEEQRLDEMPSKENLGVGNRKYHMIQEDKLMSLSVCEQASEDISCGVIKQERDNIIRRYKAATLLQAHWRGTWARKCLRTHVTFTPEVLKNVIDNVFGNLDGLSALMNEFFKMYPSTKPAFSLASALTGEQGLRQFTGSTSVTPKCKWVPYFQGVFFCHMPVKVHFDLQSSLQYRTFYVYNNDTRVQLPQVFNDHLTFEFGPNVNGYTVMGHGTVIRPFSINTEVLWQLSVLSSIDEVFHICDNDPEGCKEQPLTRSFKFKFEEIYIPNRRNILGGVQISVLNQEVVSFRIAASSPDLPIEAILRTTEGSIVQQIDVCSGNGEVYWPYVRLDATQSRSSLNKQSVSQSNLITVIKEGHASSRSLKIPKSMKPGSGGGKHKSSTRIKGIAAEPKLFYLEVLAPQGWPLTSAQWRRVDEIRNSPEFIKMDSAQTKKPGKDKPTSAKERDKDKQQTTSMQQLHPDDAFTIIECALAVGGGANVRRDDDRDLDFAAAVKAWDIREPGRNNKGAHMRKDFRAEFLETAPSQPESAQLNLEEFETEVGEEYEDREKRLKQGPTPATESVLTMEATVESEEEKYLTLPEQLQDKMKPLDFIPYCMKDEDENMKLIMTPELVEAEKQRRRETIKAGVRRAQELQEYNETCVLGRQKLRCQLVEKLFVDSQWSEGLTAVFQARDDAIAMEILSRNLSAIKKKQDVKKK